MTDFSRRVYEVTCKIPKGRVMSYGHVAALAGNFHGSRAVGYILHRNPMPGRIPCHRVVFKDGSLAPGFAFGGADAQRCLLENEGISFLPDGKVDMKKHGI